MTAPTFPSSEPSDPPAAPQTLSPQPASRRVTDATTRMLHWLMALSFTGAYLTADGDRWQLVHVTLGYTLAGLLVFRVLWGWVGPRQVRLSVLWRKLKGLPVWLKSLPTVNSQATLLSAWRQGENLLMALAVALILAVIIPLTLSGYAFWEGWGGEWLEDVHEFFGKCPAGLGAGAYRLDCLAEPVSAQKPGFAHVDGPRCRSRARSGQAQPPYSGGAGAGLRDGFLGLAVD